MSLVILGFYKCIKIDHIARNTVFMIPEPKKLQLQQLQLQKLNK